MRLRVISGLLCSAAAVALTGFVTHAQLPAVAHAAAGRTVATAGTPLIWWPDVTAQQQRLG
ncbi:hypothetical protein [Streptomyces sp. CB02460]|uniref:hypothetical protein n=1 Tax=Streptomyces sp. CB02460 TaxID=1703941 RepID=UPI00093F2D85|nr:hypothetical protein [Streptomyces sp. CB02460]OKJ72768.1 hypothetical protein AMK30_17540 [Streptomyces sp. CB02460]